MFCDRGADRLLVGARAVGDRQRIVDLGDRGAARRDRCPSRRCTRSPYWSTVPATSAVAVLNGGPATRIGGWPAPTSKKSCAAATAEAAESATSRRACRPRCSARSASSSTVAASVAPMVNSSGAGRGRGRGRQRQRLGRAVRQREAHFDRLAGVRLRVEVDRDRGRRAGRPGHGRAGHGRGDRRELEAERMAGDIFGNADDVRGRSASSPQARRSRAAPCRRP